MHISGSARQGRRSLPERVARRGVGRIDLAGSRDLYMRHLWSEGVGGDRALAEFSELYPDQNETDYTALSGAFREDTV